MKKFMQLSIGIYFIVMTVAAIIGTNWMHKFYKGLSK